MTDGIKFERYDADNHRIMRDGEVIGMIMRYSNGKWAVCDRKERSISILFTALTAAKSRARKLF